MLAMKKDLSASAFVRVCCLAILYGLICRKLWRSRHRMRRPTASTREKHHKQTIKMLAVVVLAFVFCWLPFHIGRILFAWTGIGEHTLYQVSQYLNLVSMLLFYLSASLNPVLYNIMSQKYRLAMKKILYHSQALQSRNVARSEPNSTEGTEDISSL
ncbi:growth hormone secretagogue receptor type 1-like [Rhinatrema bivittatum]|uniref:growth hormone secretagogue receptor type 1-like n=1 Tax=Rhinatrema bivittatum TaxID=194408 RepID=UPI00112B0A30|nr:growth hormone secretagogue receptor type 1-like [Rhinatrema bivittatum]